MKNEVTDAKKHNRDPKFTKSQLDVILQPIKPVYVNNVQKDIGDGKSIGVRTYIKISSFPLIPQLVENTDLYEVMKHMNSNGIDLHVFESGIKVGAPSLVVDNDGKELKRDKLSIFNKDGSIDMNGVSLMSANSLILPIKGWKIQQEVPYHEHPGTVNKITQAAKSLFNNIRDVKGFKYDGKTHDGFGLEDIYNKIYEKIHQRELAKLKDELYQKDSDGMPISIDTEKLSKILQEEAISKGYTLNDQIGLFLDEGGRDFRFPLWSLPSAHKYESLIISLVDNRTRKLKFPGNSFVLGSEAGFKFKKFTDSKDDLKAVLEKYKNKIIFTSNHLVSCKIIDQKQTINQRCVEVRCLYHLNLKTLMVILLI
jgi:hypothetical protein